MMTPVVTMISRLPNRSDSLPQRFSVRNWMQTDAAVLNMNAT